MKNLIFVLPVLLVGSLGAHADTLKCIDAASVSVASGCIVGYDTDRMCNLIVNFRGRTILSEMSDRLKKNVDFASTLNLRLLQSSKVNIDLDQLTRAFHDGDLQGARQSISDASTDASCVSR